MPETTPRRAVRPARPRLRPDALTVGIDIGGTKVLSGVVDGSGNVIERLRRPTLGSDVRAVEDTIVEVVKEFGSRYDLAAVGIGAAGFVDATRSIVMFAPHLAWRNEPLRASVAERVRLPVVVDNDANAAGLAECRFGAGVGHRYVMCATLGTGIGGALLIDGRIHRGANGMAGEFGHIQMVEGGHRCPCGNRGCLEQYASGRALEREARELIAANSPVAHRLTEICDGDPTKLTGPDVTDAAKEGDPLSIELLADVGHWLGVGLAGFAAAFDPSLVIIGGGVSDAGNLLLEPTRKSFSRALVGRGFRAEPQIVAARMGPEANFIGAADMARSAASRSLRSRRRREGQPRRESWFRRPVD
ncbi:MAG: ROK family glucokinase [Nocardioidaceae bacterium]|nr:MAG: ROK family glucokinase [Nocardioidaceae bacterium]